MNRRLSRTLVLTGVAMTLLAACVHRPVELTAQHREGCSLLLKMLHSAGQMGAKHLPYRWAEAVAAGIDRKPAPVVVSLAEGVSSDMFSVAGLCADQTFEFAIERELPPEQGGIQIDLEARRYGLRFVACHVLLNGSHGQGFYLDGCLEGHAAGVDGDWMLSNVLVGTGEDEEEPAPEDDAAKGHE